MTNQPVQLARYTPIAMAVNNTNQPAWVTIASAHGVRTPAELRVPASQITMNSKKSAKYQTALHLTEPAQPMKKAAARRHQGKPSSRHARSAASIGVEPVFQCLQPFLPATVSVEYQTGKGSDDEEQQENVQQCAAGENEVHPVE